MSLKALGMTALAGFSAAAIGFMLGVRIGEAITPIDALLFSANFYWCIHWSIRASKEVAQ